jgi:hypothetical protein
MSGKDFGELMNLGRKDCDLDCDYIWCINLCMYMDEKLPSKASSKKAVSLLFIFDKSMNILLVEDNKTIATNIQKYLELEHFQVDVSYDGEE